MGTAPVRYLICQKIVDVPYKEFICHKHYLNWYKFDDITQRLNPQGADVFSSLKD
ncbi:hypothetical protein NIES2098_38910 [Calothrix sp. NIES-2098]|nr:hypothetical protein NIES2098_38910 [Calothrix sp. NIES-2098]